MCLLQALGFVSYRLTCTRCKFLLILGELWSYFVHFVSKYKNSWCAQIMGSFSSFFRTLLCSYHNIFYSCGSKDLWSSWFNWNLLIACFNWYLLIAWLLVSLFVMSLWHIFLLQSLGLNIVCLPPSIYRWICVLHSTLLLRNTQFMEEHILYWPSKLLAHFGNRCQWGRSFREFCGEV